MPSSTDSQQRLAAGAGVRRRRDPSVPRRAGAPLPRIARRGRTLRPRRRTDGRGEGRRLVPGADGVRPARAWGAQHPRRRPQPRDAVGDEPEDQVPRVVPAVRPVGAARTRRRLFRDAAGRGEPLHAAGGPGRRPSAASRRRPDATLHGARQAEDLPLDDSGGHARRLLGPRADGRRRAARPVSTSCSRRSTTRPAAR